MGSRMIGIAVAAFLALASQLALAGPPSAEVAAACSRVSPSMQSAVLEAVIYGGGPITEGQRMNARVRAGDDGAAVGR